MVTSEETSNNELLHFHGYVCVSLYTVYVVSSYYKVTTNQPTNKSTLLTIQTDNTGTYKCNCVPATTLRLALGPSHLLHSPSFMTKFKKERSFTYTFQ
jgi:hypothetical protein